MEKSNLEAMPPVYTVCSIEMDPSDSIPSPPTYESVFGNMEQKAHKKQKKRQVSEANADPTTQSGANTDSKNRSQASANNKIQPEAKNKPQRQPKAKTVRQTKCDNASLIICCRTLSRPGPFIVVLCSLLILPVSFIIIGSVYVNDCPASSHVPVLEIVDGSLSFVSLLLLLRKKINEYYKNDENDQAFNKLFGVLAPTIMIGAIICFIVVAEGIYSLFQSDWVSDSSSSSSSDRFCHPVLVYFTFSFVTAVLAFIGLSILLWILDGILMPPLKRCIANRSKK